MCGRGRRGSNGACSILCQFSVTSSTTHNQVGPFWYWFPGVWACVRSRTLWVSPTNSPVRLGVSPAAASTPTRVFSQRLLVFISPHWNPGLCGLSRSLVVPPGLSVHKCGSTLSASHHFAWSTSRHLARPSPPAAALPRVLSTRLLISTPPTGLDECFFFNSLVVGLPYSLIFCQFWLVFFFNLLLSFFWLCEEAQCVYLHLHLGQK